MKKSGEKNFLMDGFPRNKENIDGWEKLIGDRVNIQCVLVFDCDEKVKKNIYIFFFF
jgi:UMP-CMP kinase